MRKRNITSYSIKTAIAAVIAMPVVLLGQIAPVQAETCPMRPQLSKDSPVKTSVGVHKSDLEIDNKADGEPITKNLTLALNKSLMVRLTRDIKDVIVSNPDFVDVIVQTPKRIYIVGKKLGQANIFIFDGNEAGKPALTFEVEVSVDTRPLDAMLSRFIPGSKICTETLNDTLILTGTVRNPADSSRAVMLANRFATRADSKRVPEGHDNKVKSVKVINMLVVEGEEQVMLRVKFAEVQRSVLKQFGINLGASFANGNNLITLLSDNKLPVTTSLGLSGIGQAGIVPGAGIADVALPLIDGGLVGNSGIAGAFLSDGGTRSLSYTLKALERNGLVRTLAEPNLTAVSGESANFLAGGEFPIPVSSDDDGVTVEFKEYGVGLAFTPVVLSEGRISLKISTEVSELSTAGSVTFSSIAIPALTKRRTESTVELPSGGTLAMSGLVQNNMQKNIDGFPGLKELPVLGALFRSSDFVKRETELIVMVTPYIVRPTAKRKLAAPTDGLAAANDSKTYLLGHLNRIHGRSVSLPSGSLKDSYGFIVD